MINTANAKGILFSTAMVKAIPDGWKTQTRRVAKYTYRDVLKAAGNPYPEGREKKWTNCPSWMAEWYLKEVARPRYKVGDILYVKETFQKLDSSIALDLEHGNYCYVYKATENGEAWASEMEDWKWRSPLYMPKEAARIWLEVTGVRAERVQDITAEDCVEEGMDIDWSDDMPKPAYVSLAYYKIKIAPAYKKAFAELWDSINAKPKPVYRTVEGRKIIARYESYPWEDVQETREYRGKEWRVHGNPWVFVYTFRDVSGEVEKDA